MSTEQPTGIPTGSPSPTSAPERRGHVQPNELEAALMDSELDNCQWQGETSESDSDEPHRRESLCVDLDHEGHDQGARKVLAVRIAGCVTLCKHFQECDDYESLNVIEAREVRN